ncbi:MAG: PrgI family protein [Candidatus Nealsonbacteria bacterium]|nr:PrgI family protein [Candidatus Nealsonbacteria bacterium]
MDQFTVPQFIEHKAKIVGPLTFQQFIFVGIAVAISFFLYFAVPLMFFVAGSLVLVGTALGLAFGSAGGRSLPLVLKNFSAFFFAPKLYLWKKKVGPPPKLIKEAAPVPTAVRETPVPTIVGKSHLKNLSTRIETK